MSVKKAETFAALCVALVNQARERTETAWRAMRRAQSSAEGEFSHRDGNPWYAAMGLCAEEGVYADCGRTVPLRDHADALRAIKAAHSDAVDAARIAVRNAMGARR